MFYIIIWFLMNRERRAKKMKTFSIWGIQKIIGPRPLRGARHVHPRGSASVSAIVFYGRIPFCLFYADIFNVIYSKCVCAASY